MVGDIIFSDQLPQVEQRKRFLGLKYIDIMRVSAVTRSQVEAVIFGLRKVLTELELPSLKIRDWGNYNPSPKSYSIEQLLGLFLRKLPLFDEKDESKTIVTDCLCVDNFTGYLDSRPIQKDTRSNLFLCITDKPLIVMNGAEEDINAYLGLNLHSILGEFVIRKKAEGAANFPYIVMTTYGEPEIGLYSLTAAHEFLHTLGILGRQFNAATGGHCNEERGSCVMRRYQENLLNSFSDPHQNWICPDCREQISRFRKLVETFKPQSKDLVLSTK